MAGGLTNRSARKLFLKTLEGFAQGSLELVCPDGTYHFGRWQDPGGAVIAVHNERFFTRAILAGDVGIGESYMDGDWSTPDLVAVVRLAVRNLNHLESSHRVLSAFRRVADWLQHRSKCNSEAGSKRNIAYHYDLGNDFYRLFLDRTLAYSSGYYERESDSLEAAQIRKYEHICNKLRLGPNDHLLEIGTGWGGFAAFAAENLGCRITTTTISREQHDEARQLFAAAGEGGARITLLLEDYRNLQGSFNKLVSIEMFEAVGLDYYDAFFSTCDRLLTPDGSMLIQAITMNEHRFDAYRKQSDWIQRRIFPGAQLASIREILNSLVRSTRLSLYNVEDIGLHYAYTLAEWRRRFHESLDEVRALGFDEAFCRMWDYYLAYCEGAFRERHISDVQLMLTKNANPAILYGEPWKHKGESEVLAAPELSLGLAETGERLGVGV